MTVGEFFKGRADSRRIHLAIAEVVGQFGEVGEKVSKSHVAFRRGRAFAWTWIPGQYLSGERPPLVLSMRLPRRDGSDRWKEVVEPRHGQFMHHVELSSEGEVDDQIAEWLREAWTDAGPRG